MQSWNDRVLDVAKIFGVTQDVLNSIFSQQGIDEHSLVEGAFDEFKQVITGEQRISSKSPFVLRQAFNVLVGKVLPVTAEQSPIELLSKMTLRVPNDRSRSAYQILKKKRVRADSPRTWGDVHFIVLNDAGEPDLDATTLAIRGLENGDSDLNDGVFISKDTGKYYAVYQLDDVVTLENPRARRLYDPFAEGQFLNSNKVSSKLGVIVDLDPDRHQLLLFACRSNLIAKPRDEREARELLHRVASAPTLDEAARNLGEKLFVRWQAAKRTPAGSPAQLPSITEAEPNPTSGPDRRTANVFSMAATEITESNAADLKLSLLSNNDARDVLMTARVEDLRELLRELGHSPQGTSKSDLVTQILRINPPLKSIFDFIILFPEGPLNEPGFAAFTKLDYTDTRNEIFWRIIAHSAIAQRTAAHE